MELTLNKPNTLLPKRDKRFYFILYARDIEGKELESSKSLRKDIQIYIKSNVWTNVYATLSMTREMEDLDMKNNIWKTSFGDAGGVKSIEISRKDKD